MAKVVEHGEDSPDWKLGRSHNHQEVPNAMDPIWVVPFIRIDRLFERDHPEDEENDQQEGDDVPQDDHHPVTDLGTDLVGVDIQHEVEVLADIVGPVDPADANHFENGNPQH